MKRVKQYWDEPFFTFNNKLFCKECREELHQPPVKHVTHGMGVVIGTPASIFVMGHVCTPACILYYMYVANFSVCTYVISVYHVYLLVKFIYFPTGTDLTMSISHHDKICKTWHSGECSIYSVIINHSEFHMKSYIV